MAQSSHSGPLPDEEARVITFLATVALVYSAGIVLVAAFCRR